MIKERYDFGELAEVIGNTVNTYCTDYKAFCESMDNQHRTLQQSAMRLFMKWVEHCASDDYMTDGRNEQTKALAKEIVEKVEKRHLSLI